MRKKLLFIFTISFAVIGFNFLANAQNPQIEDMQKQMMQTMQQQMMKSMGGGFGGGMGGQPAPSAQAVSQERARAGEEVFSDSSLGTNGKSCKTCHSKPGQKPLDGRKVTPHLIAFIQYCYNNALKGPGIMAETKLNALVDYFTSLQR